ncbi:MAG: hypothetical protein DWQ07_10050 [Chloroflexi bacterium]|nr:MAG: hypothetical protein DWQ07_10050 [Chloroflexota bacterium]MBL1192947.1 hypothetical protein [Chloroflexota bacterium]NOH10239.1 hypothetical protein [Chloroflexota bacterium]
MMDFHEFATTMQAHLEDGNFADGLELLDKQAAKFPSHVAQMSLWRIALLTGVGETTAATEMLERALENGVWYSEKLLRNTAPLNGLAGEEEFERLVAISVQMQLADPATAMPLIAVHAEGKCQSEGDPCPLLLFLHDNEETPQEHLQHWRSVPTMGWLLAMPQSVQALWAGAYTWADTQIAQEQLELHYDNLSAGYQLDTERLVIGGKGTGTGLALELVGKGTIPASGLVFYQPSGELVKQPARWEKHIAQAGKKGLRVVIIADDIIAKQLDILTAYFDEHKLAYKVGTFPATEEAYPQGFENSLSNALDFLENPPDNS